jgi:hypothetical protein
MKQATRFTYNDREFALFEHFGIDSISATMFSPHKLFVICAYKSFIHNDQSIYSQVLRNVCNYLDDGGLRGTLEYDELFCFNLDF